jgi:hypothetical protein
VNLTDLNLCHCESLSDFKVLLDLPKLTKVYISKELEDLVPKELLDNKIVVLF